MTRHIPWIVTAIIGVVALTVVAISRGESVNALWIVVAAVSCFLVAYRYYALFIARHVMRIDPARPTPAVRRADGLDYVATDRTVLFGHHFAAIAGAGPLVGPVLAAQMGYLPGTLWIIFGVVLAGAVQDFMVLFISMRRDGKSLGELIRMEMGQVAGTIALFGAFMIMVIILAVLALIVVKALMLLTIQTGGLPAGIGPQLLVYTLRELASLILDYVFWAVLVRVILSWVAPDPYSPVVRVIVQITEPIMAPVRKLLPPMGGFDLSPLFVLLGIQLLQILFQLR